MKVYKFDSKEAWLNARLGKALGSRAKKVLPDRYGHMTKGAWELVAERLIGSAAIEEEERAMDRGTRLEPVAIERFMKETGKKVDSSLLMWVRDDDESIGVSPDGVIGKTEAVEVKCLNAASHIEAKVTGKIPKNVLGYEEQALQYFCTNDKLKTLFFVFYDPRFPTGLDFFYIEMTRKAMKEDIVDQLQKERDVLKWVRDTVNALTFYSPDEIQKAEEVKKELLSEHASDLERVHAGMKDRILGV